MARGLAQLEMAHAIYHQTPWKPAFCNLTALGWLAEEKLTPLTSQEQRMKQAYRVGREEEGMSSTGNRPELVALRECLEGHRDHENLLYLTDSEATLQAINKWIGGGAKLSLARSPDGDVFRAIIVKLQKRVLAGRAHYCSKSRPIGAIR